MATVEDLERCVSEAIQNERYRVKQKRLAHPSIKYRLTDYAAIVVACGYQRSSSTFSARSESPLYHHYTEIIKKRLEGLAPIGEKRQECNNTIGACAEPHAADMVIKSFPGCKIDELQFSTAYRPRTAKRKKYCRNCKDTFPEVL